jgi:hypothetical protein
MPKLNSIPNVLLTMFDILEIEVGSPRPTANSRRPAEADCGHGGEQCYLR